MGQWASFDILLYTEDDIFPFNTHWTTQPGNREVDSLTTAFKRAVTTAKVTMGANL